MKGKVKKEKDGDIITDSISRHPPSLRLSFKYHLPEDLMFSLRETLTLSAAKLGLCLHFYFFFQSTAAVKLYRIGSQSKRRKHNVSKDAKFFTNLSKNI